MSILPSTMSMIECFFCLCCLSSIWVSLCNSLHVQLKYTPLKTKWSCYWYTLYIFIDFLWFTGWCATTNNIFFLLQWSYCAYLQFPSSDFSAPFSGFIFCQDQFQISQSSPMCLIILLCLLHPINFTNAVFLLNIFLWFLAFCY